MSDVDFGDWNDRIKKIVAGLAGMIPNFDGVPIGAMISLLINLFWPSSKTSTEDIFKALFKEIKEMVEKIVKVEILENEIAERKSEIEGLKTSMEEYVAAKDHQKGSLLSAMIVNSNTITAELENSRNDIHLLPLAVIFAYQHLTLLRELAVHGKEMYNEDNTPVWMADLVKKVKYYEDYFLKKKDKWNKYRRDIIKTNYKVTHDGGIAPPKYVECIITDELSEKKWRYVDQPGQDSSNPEEILGKGVNWLTTRIFNGCNVSMVKVLIPTFSLHTFIPDKAKDPAIADKSIGIVHIGPLSESSSDGDRQLNDFNHIQEVHPDRQGKITSIYTRAYNSIDATQITYDNHTGTKSGANGGKPYTFGVPEKDFINYVRYGFAHNLLWGCEYKTSGGHNSGVYGGFNGVSYQYSYKTEDILDDSFQLRCIELGGGPGPSNTYGVANVMLTYYHDSLIRTIAGK